MKLKTLKYILNRLLFIESILLFISMIKESYNTFFILAIIILVIILIIFFYLIEITKE